MAGICTGGQQYDRPRWVTIGQARCAAAEGSWLKKAAEPRPSPRRNVLDLTPARLARTLSAAVDCFRRHPVVSEGGRRVALTNSWASHTP